MRTLYEAARQADAIVSVVRSSTADLDDADYTRLLELGATLTRRGRGRRSQRGRGNNNTDQVLDIEMRRPASEAHLRGWTTDDEALDDVANPVGTDNRRPVISKSCDANIHRLVISNVTVSNNFIIIFIIS